MMSPHHCVEELRDGAWVQVARPSGEGFAVDGGFLERIKAALGVSGADDSEQS
jgi:hypothetical protein